MQAIILASGVGRRLGMHTASKPKCLVEIAGRPLLGRILDILSREKIREIFVTTGAFAEQVSGYTKMFSHLPVRLVHNGEFSETNYIYSLWRAADFIKGDVLLIHSDVLFDEGFVAGLIASTESVVAVHRDNRGPDKDFRARIEAGRVCEISVGVKGEYVRGCMPLYKFLFADWKVLAAAVDTFIANGRVTSYAEDAFNTVLHQIGLKPYYYTDPRIMEVDDLNDLEQAERVWAEEVRS